MTASPPKAGTTFGVRLQRLVASRGPLCVGIDPHPEVLRSWDLDATVAGLERCARRMVEAVAGEVAMIKPQSAFFETYGSAGIRVLEQVITDAHDRGTQVLLDVKRGDIGSTMAAYAQAYLADGAPLAADAITLSPYLGVEALEPAFELAERTGRGVFVLALTSNHDAALVQRAATEDGPRVAQAVVDAVGARNPAGADGWGPFGIVVGATHEQLGLDLTGLPSAVLAPGLGAQGGTPESLAAAFGPAAERVIPSSSRGIMAAGPEVETLRARVRQTVAALRATRAPAAT